MEATKPMGRHHRYTTMPREKRIELARSVLDEPDPLLGTTTLAIGLLVEAEQRDELLAACQAAAEYHKGMMASPRQTDRWASVDAILTRLGWDGHTGRLTFILNQHEAAIKKATGGTG